MHQSRPVIVRVIACQIRSDPAWKSYKDIAGASIYVYVGALNDAAVILTTTSSLRSSRQSDNDFSLSEGLGNKP